MELTDAAFQTQAARADATTNTDIHSIGKRGGGIGSRLVSSMGWSRARETKGRVDAIAADHAEDRIERRFNDEVGEKIRDARKRYEDDYRRPLQRRGELPDHIRFSSNTDGVAIEVTQANQRQLGASASAAGGPCGPRYVDAIP